MLKNKTPFYLVKRADRHFRAKFMPDLAKFYAGVDVAGGSMGKFLALAGSNMQFSAYPKWECLATPRKPCLSSKSPVFSRLSCVGPPFASKEKVGFDLNVKI